MCVCVCVCIYILTYPFRMSRIGNNIIFKRSLTGRNS